MLMSVASVHLAMGGEGTLGRLIEFAGFGAQETTGPYTCLSCGASFEVQYHVCPECGGYSVEANRE